MLTPLPLSPPSPPHPSLSPPLRLPEAVAHEAARVFRDRLVEGAGESFNSLLAAVLNSMINFR